MKKQDIKKLIVLGTVLGIGYLGYSYYFQDRSCLTLNQTRQIAQEIKHQMLGVTIIFSQKSSQSLQKLRKQNKGEDAQLVQFYTAKIGQFYKQKQSIILDKQNVSLEKYQRSLKAHEKDEKLSKILSDILQMMSKSANGEVPDLTVDKRAINKFGKPQVKKIYQDMTKMILVSVLGRLKQQQKVNNSFDPSIDRQFKRVIKGINMFSKKTQFFKQRGVSQQWGHPNQVFLKLTQSYKISDAQFRSEMEVLQTLFDKILIDITKDLQNYTINKIYTQFAQAQQKNKNQILSRSAYQPQIFQNEQIELNINKSTRSQPQGHQQFQQHNRQDLRDQFFDENSVSKIK